MTICTADRARLFTADNAVALVMCELSRTAEVERFAVIAYCFMPDHFHALVEATSDDGDFQRFARVFKQRSAFQWKRRTKKPLWQRSFFDHILRDDEDTYRVARYLLENPLRAGLATKPEDYRFLGSLTMDLRDLLYSVQVSGPT